MDLPTPRELELETLLRQRDAQLADLTDEVTHLRQYLTNQPAPVVTDPISLPPPLVSLLLPHINDRSTATPSSSSSTVTAALTQRVKVLQEENDELYELLKTSETGRLKEDVRSLRRVVQKLEGALRDSHEVITSLSEELEKAQATVLANGRTTNHPSNPRGPSHSPVTRTNYNLPPHMSQPANGTGKLPPTGPRAHKKPRLSETPSLPPSNNPSQQSKGNRSQSGSTSIRRQDSPEHSPRTTNDRKMKMEVDDEDRRQWSPERSRDHERDREKDRTADRERDRDRDRDRGHERERPSAKERERDRRPHRERDRDRERDRERTRDSDRSSKRNGAYGSAQGASGGATGGGGRRARRGSNATSSGGDRTLKERMGL